MDQAKAVIDLKGGVIQLEGPVEFVRHYLDACGAGIKELQGTRQSAPASRETQASARRSRRKTESVSITSALHQEFEAGFFAEPRSVRETSQRLTEKGMTCNAESIRMALNRLHRKGMVEREKGRTSSISP